MKILGHRGAILPKGAFYQNSLVAFEEALSTADGFESDACLTSDNEIFLIHEAKYVDPAKGVEYCLSDHLTEESKTVVAGRRLDQLTSSEMASLRLHGDLPIPTLRRALELTGSYPGKCIDIELKAFGVAVPTVDLVLESVKRQKIETASVIFSSFNHPSLEVVRAKAPDHKVGAIFVGPDQPSTPLFPWHPESDARYTALHEKELRNPLLKKIDPDFIIFPEEYLTKETVDLISAHYPRAQIMAWVFTEKENFNLADLILRLGALHHTGKIAGIMPDNPRQFCKALPRFLRESS